VDEHKTEKTDKCLEFLLKENLEMKHIILDVLKNVSEMQTKMMEICKKTYMQQTKI